MYRFLTPVFFLKIEKFLVPILLFATPSMFCIGIYYAFFNSPPDYQQGEMVRIMYIHVPSAWMSLGVYSFMSVCSFFAIIWRTRMSYILAIASAPIGAIFALITLVTGSIWGKPIWGAWWVWDARLTSMLVLFLLYISYISIINSGSNILRAEKPASVMCLIGFINIPIVKFSVDIWYSLHQPASVIRLGGSAIHNSMMMPLMIMFVSFIMYFILATLMRVRVILSQLKQDV
ncbi:heme ABC transporter permease [Rickettsiaceae bacterium]|nr:heme ABC transporter permease [Rickettsiaceae bacterium]